MFERANFFTEAKRREVSYPKELERTGKANILDR